MKIILGSKSESRKKILAEMGYSFDVLTADIDEKSIRLIDPNELTLALANAKADAIKKKTSEPAILITSDQVVTCNGKILEKPENEGEVKEFLSQYNKFPAETVTAVVATNLVTGKKAQGVDIVKVFFSRFDETDIEEIIKDGKTFKYAGGFDVDNETWKWADRITKFDGAKDSIMGLPKALTAKLICEVMN